MTVPSGLVAFACFLAAAAALLYAVLLTHNDGRPFGADPAGLTFNSMLSHLLQGRWDVDPSVIGFEAFIRDGRAYAYFGPLPALLRLPLLVLPDWRGLHVERLSCWLAILSGSAGESGAILAALSRAPAATRSALAPALLACATFGGPPMLLAWRGGLIYHESILWAWALAMLFVLVAVRGLVGGDRRLGTRALTLMTACAGLCLLTRSTTGAGLFAALGLLMLRALLVADPAGARPPVARRLWQRVRHPEFWGPTLLGSGFVCLAGIINLGRWGHVLQFADMHAQVALLTVFPDRLVRLERYGLFNIQRLCFGLLYYVAPVWNAWAEAALPLDGRIARLFDALELPSASIVLTDPLWCVLACRGIGLMLRGRAFPGAVPLAVGLCFAPLLMLVAWYMAFRYRVEFTPLLVAISCTGLAGWAPTLDMTALRGARLLLLGLCALQIVSAAVFGVVYDHTSLGPNPGHPGIALLGS